ncbi:MAG TPA: hypothetical protein VFM68_04455, partial [Candidatus Saccharimonadales bacterium]|nr:hypothetical protein [Candidatus Saccharimonadales bacterium]
VTKQNGLTACKIGQYRHPETNRCRNTISTSGSLKPCKANQYRSAETNRCRNVATAASTLKPCNDNQYRSAETNRCRKIVATSVPEAAFAVEPVVESGKAFVGWWTLGGVGALAIGYGAWEWRREAATALRKVAEFFTSTK